MAKALKIVGGCIGLCVLVLIAVKFRMDAQYFSDYDPTLPFNEVIAEETLQVGALNQEETETYEYKRISLSFDEIPGESVPTLLTLPKETEGPVPCVIFLHGIGQKKEFLDEICAPFNKEGFAMVCFDQYMQGERKVKKNFLKQAMAFRKRPAKTINDTRRLIDYLETRPDIDADRIYLVGASYGAITGTTVTAFDKRVKASVLVYGGADLGKLLSAPLIQQEVGGLTVSLLTPVVKYLMGAADPEKYAAKTSPTPVFLQNGKKDCLVCPAAAEALQAAVGEPKEIKWYDSDHIGMHKEEYHVVYQVLDDGLKWILKQDAPYRKETLADAA